MIPAIIAGMILKKAKKPAKNYVESKLMEMVVKAAMKEGKEQLKSKIDEKKPQVQEKIDGAVDTVKELGGVARAQFTSVVQQVKDAVAPEAPVEAAPVEAAKPKRKKRVAKNMQI